MCIGLLGLMLAVRQARKDPTLFARLALDLHVIVLPVLLHLPPLLLPVNRSRNGWSDHLIYSVA